MTWRGVHRRPRGYADFRGRVPDLCKEEAAVFQQPLSLLSVTGRRLGFRLASGSSPVVLRVFAHLIHRDLHQIDIQDVGKPYEIEKYVRYFRACAVANRIGLSCADCLVCREPLKDLAEFTHLSHQREDQRFGVVVLLPLPLRCEGAQGIPEDGKSDIR